MMLVIAGLDSLYAIYHIVVLPDESPTLKATKHGTWSLEHDRDRCIDSPSLCSLGMFLVAVKRFIDQGVSNLHSLLII